MKMSLVWNKTSQLEFSQQRSFFLFSKPTTMSTPIYTEVHERAVKIGFRILYDNLRKSLNIDDSTSHTAGNNMRIFNQKIDSVSHNPVQLLEQIKDFLSTGAQPTIMGHEEPFKGIVEAFKSENITLADLWHLVTVYNIQNKRVATFGHTRLQLLRCIRLVGSFLRALTNRWV